MKLINVFLFYSLVYFMRLKNVISRLRFLISTKLLNSTIQLKTKTH